MIEYFKNNLASYELYQNIDLVFQNNEKVEVVLRNCLITKWLFWDMKSLF